MCDYLRLDDLKIKVEELRVYSPDEQDLFEDEKRQWLVTGHTGVSTYDLEERLREAVKGEPWMRVEFDSEMSQFFAYCDTEAAAKHLVVLATDHTIEMWKEALQFEVIRRTNPTRVEA